MTQNLHTLSELRVLCTQLRLENQTLVFTNGCFDLLHPGHLTYLEQAKAFGDILIVGLNSDRSVQNLKGTSRPILPEKDRARMLGGLKPVDHVILFDSPTPIPLIKELQPDVHVKGGDYQAEALPEYDTVLQYGGCVKIVPFISGYSSSQLIQSIQSSPKTAYDQTSS